MKYYYSNEVFDGTDRAGGINELEFISAAVEMKVFDKIFIPGKKGNIEKASITYLNVPSVGKILGSLLYQFKLIGELLKNKTPEPAILILRPSILTFYPLLLSRKKYKIILKLTDLIPENILTFKDENKLYSSLNFIIKFLHNKIIKRADALVCVTPEIGSYYKERMNVEKIIRTIPNGVNTDKFISVNKKKNEYGQKISIGYVGVLRSYINFTPLLKAIKKLSHSYDIELTIIGSGPKESSVRHKVQELGLENHVDFKGSLEYEKMPSEISKFDIGLAFFSDEKIKLTGTSSLKIGQYLSCGIPVLTNSCPSHEFIAKNNLGSTIKDSESINEIANSILKSKESNSSNIRQYAIENLSYNQLIKQFLGIASLISN